MLTEWEPCSATHTLSKVCHDRVKSLECIPCARWPAIALKRKLLTVANLNGNC
jgi:hypothetical protein